MLTMLDPADADAHTAHLDEHCGCYAEVQVPSLYDGQEHDGARVRSVGCNTHDILSDAEREVDAAIAATAAEQYNGSSSALALTEKHLHEAEEERRIANSVHVMAAADGGDGKLAVIDHDGNQNQVAVYDAAAGAALNAGALSFEHPTSIRVLLMALVTLEEERARRQKIPKSLQHEFEDGDGDSGVKAGALVSCTSTTAAPSQDNLSKLQSKVDRVLRCIGVDPNVQTNLTLRSIDLSRVYTGSTIGASAFIHLVDCCPSVSMLDLSGQGVVQSDAVCDLAQIAANHPQLSKINLSGTFVDAKGLKHLLRAAKQNSRIREVVIDREFSQLAEGAVGRLQAQLEENVAVMRTVDSMRTANNPPVVPLRPLRQEVQLRVKDIYSALRIDPFAAARVELADK